MKTSKYIYLLAACSCCNALQSATIASNFVVAPVNDVGVFVGADQFSLIRSDSPTNDFFFFGNATGPFAGTNLGTANRVPLFRGTRPGPAGPITLTQQYFQLDTADLTLSSAQGSSYSYALNGTSNNSGSTTGLNFSAYDIDQNGSVDTLFALTFGDSLDDQSDDLILAFATTSDGSALDLFEARAALAVVVPEPSTSTMLMLLAPLLVYRNRKPTAQQATAQNPVKR